MKLSKIKLADIKLPRITRRYRHGDRLLLEKSIKKLGELRPLLTVNSTTNNLLDGVLAYDVLKASGAKEAYATLVTIPVDMEAAARMALQNHAGEWDWKSVSEDLLAAQAAGIELATTGFRDSDYGPLIAADWQAVPTGSLDEKCHRQIGLFQ